MVVSLLHREPQDDVISRLLFNAPLGIKCIYLKISLIAREFKADSQKNDLSGFQRTWKFVKYNIFLLKSLFPSFSSATSMLSTINEILCTSFCVCIDKHINIQVIFGRSIYWLQCLMQ